MKGESGMILQSTRVYIINDWLPAQVAISAASGRIEGIHPYGTKPVDMDFNDLRIVPGFIDVHTHGAYGFDTNDGDKAGLRRWLRNIVSEGVTGLLPTTVTQSEEVLTRALRNVAEVARAQEKEPDSVPGARILGIHLEGPYLDKACKGAQPEAYCEVPDPAQCRRYWDASDRLIRIVTLAIEHDKDYRLTRSLNEMGIVPSLGHSSASYEQAVMAFANGARSVTHVYNGMAPFHHRDPGIVGASLRFHNVYGEIICDGLHSDWAAVHAFFACKGTDCGVMVSDSMRVKGLPAGTRALFGGNRIELYEDGSAHLVDSGKLAGSTLKMHEGLRNLVEKAGVPWQTAINSCTINPARLIGMEDRKGSIRTGKDADLVVLRDDYSVAATFVCGRQYY
jgi:N-acetylglucosamine-6-phosphate deacetylase